MEGVRAEALGQTKLAFDDLVNQFNAAQNTSGVEEALETKHWSHAAFYPPLILFDDIVQVGTNSNLDRIVPTVIEFVIHAHAAQSGVVGSKPSRVITLGSPWRLRALRKKALAAVMSRVRLR